MKCYRCNNELNETDEVCSKCGSKVVKLNNKKKVVNKNYSNDYYYFAIGCLITKLISPLLAFISLFNLFFPWAIISLIFSLVGYIRYKDKRNIKLIIISSAIIIIQVLIIALFFKKIINLF
ncbi:MAG: hypothetical protein IKR57_05290 [Bacilli bacterium]|nr:hypothetical protein [Bacilli bacterium]